MTPGAAPPRVPTTTPVLEAYERELPAVVEAFEAFPWRSREAYARLLGQAYHYIVHTTRLIALAASRCGPDHLRFHRRLCEYLAEEKDHDLLVLADLAALGRTIDEFPEHPLTAALYQADYYWISHVSPLGLFGRSLLLEGMAAERCAWAAAEVSAAFGPEAASCLRVHGEEDPGHVEAALAALEQVTETEAAVIATALTQAAVLYRGMLDAVRTGAGV